MDETDPETSAEGGSVAHRRPSRRWFVAGGLALVIGGGAGVAGGFARGAPARHRDEPLPDALRGALADERRLLAAAKAAARSNVRSPAVTAALVRDHRAHLAALTAAASGFAAPREASDSPSAAAPAPDRETLRALEARSVHVAAARAVQLGPDAPATAALLASIAACDATHVELLT